MNSWNVWKKEWEGIAKNRKMTIAIVGLLFVPILYCGLFLWAFWDPYARLEKMPVAIVNMDTGATLNDTSVSVGDELVDKLKEDGSFLWTTVSQKEAEEGLVDESYYAVVTIPKDASENAISITEKTPSKVKLEFRPNEGFNFLAGQIANTGIIQIREQLGNTLTKTYAETIVDQVTELTSGFTEVNDGAIAIRDGVTEADKGAVKLNTYLHELSKKSLEFNDGLTQAEAGGKKLQLGLSTLQSGVNSLETASGQLSDGATKVGQGASDLSKALEQISGGATSLKDGATTLEEKSETLANGAQSVQTNTETYVSGVKNSAAGAKSVADGIAQLEKQTEALIASLPPAQQEAFKKQLSTLKQGANAVASGTAQLAEKGTALSEGTKAVAEGTTAVHEAHSTLKDGATTLAEGASKASKGATELNKGASTWNVGMTQFVSGVDTLKSGVDALATGSGDLVKGQAQLVDGGTAFVDATAQLSEGSSDLTVGMDKLKEGSTTFAKEIGKANDKVGDVKIDDEQITMISEPVEVDTNSFAHVPNYGTGFAPYFLSLGLFVGSLMLSIVFPLNTIIPGTKNGFVAWASKFGVLVAIGTVQAVAAVCLLLYGLDMQAENVPMLFGMAILTSITFMTIIQFLVTTMHDAGRFVAVVLLILQLTGSAGTFPLEIIPESLQALNPFLPMTYTVHAFKAVISSGDSSVWMQNAGVLVGMISLFAVGTIVYWQLVLKKKESVTTVA
ncbi:MAG: YhgE/Pip family protein [Bacilli bacterium]